MPASAETLWKASEIASIRAGHKAALTPTEIRDRYNLARSVKAVRTKMSELGLRSGGEFAERKVSSGPAVPQDRLLSALLRYGARHKVDLGMGREAFFAACARHGVQA